MYVFTYFPDQQTQHRAPNVRSVRWRCRLEQRRTSSPMSFMWILDMLDPEWHIATPEKIETCINEGCFKLRIYIHIRVSYLYYIMYLYNLYLLVPGFPHFQLWAQKNLPTWFSVRWKQYTLLGRLWVGSFHCGMDVGRFVHGADSRSIPSAIMCHLRGQ